MRREGYHAEFAAAVTGAAATAGPIIPPSIPMIIFAAVGEVSVGALFLAGVVPGLLLGGYLMGAVFWISRRRGYPTRARSSWREFGRASLDAAWALLAPVIVLGGILVGFVTPTEAAALAVLYSLLVGLYVYRELRWRDVPALLRRSAVATGVVMIIVAASGIMGWEVANLRIGEQVLAAIQSVSPGPWFVLLLINVLFLILGCLLDPLAIIIIFVPVFLPLVKAAGIDLVHFGLVVVLNVTIGLLTPPVGYLLYVTAALAGSRVDEVVREVTPFLVVLLGVLVLCTYWPAMVLSVPRLVLGGP
jgi:C4-dicarboxylate transporter DctM subunit